MRLAQQCKGNGCTALAIEHQLRRFQAVGSSHELARHMLLHSRHNVSKDMPGRDDSARLSACVAALKIHASFIQHMLTWTIVW